MKKNSLPFTPLQNIKIANDSRSGIKTEAGEKDKVEEIWFESSRRSSGMLFQLEMPGSWRKPTARAQTTRESAITPPKLLEGVTNFTSSGRMNSRLSNRACTFAQRGPILDIMRESAPVLYSTHGNQGNNAASNLLPALIDSMVSVEFDV